MTLFSFFTPTPIQVLIVLALGVLFFGKNLPDVARQLGLGLMELKKGMNEFKNLTKDFTDPSILTPSPQSGKALRKPSEESVPSESADRQEYVGTKFEPPT